MDFNWCVLLYKYTVTYITLQDFFSVLHIIVKGLHLYSTFQTSGHSKRFTIFASHSPIHTHIHTPTAVKAQWSRIFQGTPEFFRANFFISHSLWIFPRRPQGRARESTGQWRTGRRRCPAPISANWWSSPTVGPCTAWLRES